MQILESCISTIFAVLPAVLLGLACEALPYIIHSSINIQSSLACLPHSRGDQYRVRPALRLTTSTDMQIVLCDRLSLTISLGRMLKFLCLGWCVAEYESAHGLQCLQCLRSCHSLDNSSVLMHVAG